MRILESEEVRKLREAIEDKIGQRIGEIRLIGGRWHALTLRGFERVQDVIARAEWEKIG